MADILINSRPELSYEDAKAKVLKFLTTSSDNDDNLVVEAIMSRLFLGEYSNKINYISGQIIFFGEELYVVLAPVINVPPPNPLFYRLFLDKSSVAGSGSKVLLDNSIKTSLSGSGDGFSATDDTKTSTDKAVVEYINSIAYVEIANNSTLPVSYTLDTSYRFINVVFSGETNTNRETLYLKLRTARVQAQVYLGLLQGGVDFQIGSDIRITSTSIFSGAGAEHTDLRVDAWYSNT